MLAGKPTSRQVPVVFRVVSAGAGACASVFASVFAGCAAEPGEVAFEAGSAAGGGRGGLGGSTCAGSSREDEKILSQFAIRAAPRVPTTPTIAMMMATRGLDSDTCASSLRDRFRHLPADAEHGDRILLAPQRRRTGRPSNRSA